MPLPTEMPTLTNHQVIYIINPKGGETVAPWDQHQQVQGHGTVPGRHSRTDADAGHSLHTNFRRATTGIPSSTIRDAANAPWKSCDSTDTKWMRVTLKGNNMTPVPASGNAVSHADLLGRHTSDSAARGYGPDCGPDGSIVKVRVTAGGTGYIICSNRNHCSAPAGGTLGHRNRDDRLR